MILDKVSSSKCVYVFNLVFVLLFAWFGCITIEDTLSNYLQIDGERDIYPIHTDTYTSLCVRNYSYTIFCSLQYRTTLTIVSNMLTICMAHMVRLHYYRGCRLFMRVYPICTYKYSYPLCCVWEHAMHIVNMTLIWCISHMHLCVMYTMSFTHR